MRSYTYVADTLSRAHYDDTNFEVVENAVELQLNFIKYVSKSPENFEKLRNETLKDNELKELTKVIREGWPNSKNSLKECVKPYYKVKSDLTVVNDVIFKNQQLVIPKTMRSEMLDRLHYNHMGIKKQASKEHVFWPFMMKNLIDKVKNCEACLRYTN